MCKENNNKQPKEGRTPDPDAFKAVEPIKMFDDLYYIGNKVVGIYVLKTSEGLVLIDATENPNADEEIVIPSLERLGFGSEKILALFLTHGHFDHFLGAAKIQERTGCLVGLSNEDAAFMVAGFDNITAMDYKPYPIPRITLLVEDGKEYVYGEHSIRVMFAPGHTPGCLNFTFDVHENGEKHRVAVMGGYGIFGPGAFPGKYLYPFGVQTAVDNALLFASTCVKFWLHCKESGCDVYLNPHPHLCALFENAEKNKKRKSDGGNAFVIGTEGVKNWILERFDACLESAGKFSTMK